MSYAYDASLLERVMPRIKQFEATSGRRITPAMLDALMKGELEAEAGKAQQSRALDLQERGIANAEQATKDAKSAAKVKGVADIASTAGMGYLTYRSLTKPSPMSELIAYQKSISAPGAAAPTIAPATAGGDALLTGGTSAAQGAQTALGGGAPAVGAQATLAGGEVGSLAAYDSSLAAGAAEGVGSTAGTTAAGLGATGLLGAAGAGALGGSLLGPTLDKILPGGGKTGKVVGGAAGGALAGAAMGSIVPGVGTAIGAVVGGIVGGVGEMSVICSELLRQGRITERDRTRCVVFRFRVIPDPMFHAYLEWAAPIVAIMKRGGALNALLLPFAIRFVNYMIALQTGKIPTFAERIAWKYAWWRCSKIAQRNEQSVQEVA